MVCMCFTAMVRVNVYENSHTVSLNKIMRLNLDQGEMVPQGWMSNSVVSTYDVLSTAQGTELPRMSLVTAHT